MVGGGRHIRGVVMSAPRDATTVALVVPFGADLTTPRMWRPPPPPRNRDGSVWRCVVGDALELRADPIDRPRNTFEFFFDAHRASLELGDITTHRAKPLDE